MEIGDETGFGPDVGVLWAAYKTGSFSPAMEDGLDQEQFVQAALMTLGAYDSIWVVEDFSDGFRSGRGPVGFFGVNVYMDHTDQIIGRIRGIYYSWATARNRFRGILSLLTKFRASSRIGLYIWDSGELYFNLYNRLHEYALPVKHAGNGFFVMPGRKK